MLLQRIFWTETKKNLAYYILYIDYGWLRYILIYKEGASEVANILCLCHYLFFFMVFLPA